MARMFPSKKSRRKQSIQHMWELKIIRLSYEQKVYWADLLGALNDVHLFVTDLFLHSNVLHVEWKMEEKLFSAMNEAFEIIIAHAGGVRGECHGWEGWKLCKIEFSIELLEEWSWKAAETSVNRRMVLEFSKENLSKWHSIRTHPQVMEKHFHQARLQVFSLNQHLDNHFHDFS